MGRIVDLRTDEGEFVHANDTVAVIDPTEYELGVKQALANLKLSQARVAQTDARVNLSKLSLDRIQQLRNQELIAKEDLEKAQTEYEVLKIEPQRPQRTQRKILYGADRV